MIEFILNPWTIGIGTTVIAGIILALIFNNKKSTHLAPKIENNHTISQTVVVNPAPVKEDTGTKIKVSTNKNDIKILFVDDDTTFKIIDILKDAGWKNTSIVDDIKDTDSLEVRNTDIFFIDIKGVALWLSEKQQGLALAEAIKNKYPNKKVVIYSSDSKGDRANPALQKVDWFLPKYAEPMHFFNLLEKFNS